MAAAAMPSPATLRSASEKPPTSSMYDETHVSGPYSEAMPRKRAPDTTSSLRSRSTPPSGTAGPEPATPTSRRTAVEIAAPPATATAP